MPIYNCQAYLKEAIDSVLSQSYSNWELLAINDGSTDASRTIIEAFDDHRIRIFNQENKGVSAARNVGLSKMNGDYFCFLDADDYLPSNSLEDRLDIFQLDNTIEFVDGNVVSFKNRNNKTINEFIPNYKGNPFNKLIALSDTCFFGPTWMIKSTPGKVYRFNEGLTHGEDLLFYLSVSYSGSYYYTNRVIYNYRVRDSSAMSNLPGLEAGYRQIIEILSGWENVTDKQIATLKRKVRNIMTKSYLRKGQILKAIRATSI